MSTSVIKHQWILCPRQQKNWLASLSSANFNSFRHMIVSGWWISFRCDCWSSISATKLCQLKINAGPWLVFVCFSIAMRVYSNPVVKPEQRDQYADGIGRNSNTIWISLANYGQPLTAFTLQFVRWKNKAISVSQKLNWSAGLWHREEFQHRLTR